MERNTETLSTRDLASSHESAGDVTTTSEPEMPDAATREDQPGPHDRMAPAEEGTLLPIEEDAQPRADEPTTARADEQPRPPVGEPTDSPAAGGPGASAADQTVEASRGDADLGGASGAPGHEVENTPVKPPRTVSTQDQDTGAAPPSTGADSIRDGGGSLLPADTDATFQQRWKEIQTRFVDEPRGAVED